MSEKERFVILNTRTGDIIADVTPRAPRIGGNWVRLFQERHRQMMLDHPVSKELHAQSYVVLWYLADVSAWDNGVPGAAEVAKEMSLLPQNVSRCYQELCRANFLIKKGTRYFLNPYVVWKGTEKQWQLAVSELVMLAPA